MLTIENSKDKITVPSNYEKNDKSMKESYGFSRKRKTIISVPFNNKGNCQRINNENYTRQKFRSDC